MQIADITLAKENGKWLEIMWDVLTDQGMFKMIASSSDAGAQCFSENFGKFLGKHLS